MPTNVRERPEALSLLRRRIEALPQVSETPATEAGLQAGSLCFTALTWTGTSAAVARGRAAYRAWSQAAGDLHFRVPDGGDSWTDRPARSAHNPDGIPERT